MPLESKPELSTAERIFIRISWLQTVLAVAGVFTGAVALYAALNESSAVRRQSEAAVWPYLQVSVEDHVDDQDALFRLSLTNAGMGPARVESMQLVLRGKSVRNWREFMVELFGPDTVVPYGQNTANYRVLRPGDRLDVFQVTAPEAVKVLQSALDSDEVVLAICYCSIFDECFLMRSSDPRQAPVAVRACPDYATDGFASGR